MWNVTGREATALSSFIPAKFRVHSLLHGSHVLCALYPLTDLQDAYAQLSRVNEGSPILFAEVNNKTSEEVDDIAIQSPSETCAQHHLPLPLQLSHDGEGDQDLSPLWSSVVEACLQPHKSSPVLAERKRKRSMWKRLGQISCYSALVLAGLAVALSRARSLKG
mmetsp:Transcript_10874/g.36653  ORF Transcript_10874/g.36653 Transcript_10874/m.36653 type:complete len:164 (+) Transcript_10874:1465-1956(+)